MTWRRLRVLIQHLPPESHTMTALRNALPADEYERQAEGGEPERGRWSVEMQMLAGITDSLRRLEYILLVANSSGKGPKVKKPEPMRRPGVSGAAKKSALTEQSANTLFQLINGGAA
ncbi:MAG TPA: hypothetical protein DEQ61_09910 [Streptomyces sp.]|nr:hypothetical protein [Streptomyces sp.]